MKISEGKEIDEKSELEIKRAERRRVKLYASNGNHSSFAGIHLIKMHINKALLALSPSHCQFTLFSYLFCFTFLIQKERWLL